MSLRTATPTLEAPLVLSATDIAGLLDMESCIEAVERAFRLLGEGAARPPATCAFHVPDGGFHVKIGALEVGGRTFVASKTNANYPDNPTRHRLPTVQGAIILFDADRGVPVAILEWVALRASLFGDGCPSAPELEIGHRALALTAAYLAQAGVAVVVDATAPRRAWRRIARAMVDRFAEVRLLCPPEMCAARERDARWRPRRLPVAPACTAIEWATEYEYADCPELTIDTAARSEWTATEDLRALARRLLQAGQDHTEAPFQPDRPVAAKGTPA